MTNEIYGIVCGPGFALYWCGKKNLTVPFPTEAMKAKVQNSSVPYLYFGSKSLTEQGLPPSCDSCHLPVENLWQWDVVDFRGEKGLLW